MIVECTGSKVRAGYPFEAELAAVGAAADRLCYRRNAKLLHGFLCIVDQVSVRQNLFRHIVIRVFNLQCNRTFAVHFVQLLRRVCDLLFLFFKFTAVMITQNVFHMRMVCRAAHFIQMIEAFIAFGTGGNFVRRKQCVEFHSDQQRVLHLVLGIAGMCRQPLYINRSRSSIEVFVFQLADGASVDCIRVVNGKMTPVDMHCAVSDFFIRREHQADGSVRVFGMLQIKAEYFHDLRDTGLVVASKDGSPVRDNQCISLLL